MKRFFQGLKPTKRKYPYYNNYNFPTKIFHKTFKEDKEGKIEYLILNIKADEDNIFDKNNFYQNNNSDTESYYSSIYIISSEEDESNYYIIEEWELFDYINNPIYKNKEAIKDVKEYKNDNNKTNKIENKNNKYINKVINKNNINNPENNNEINNNNDYYFRHYINEEFYPIVNNHFDINTESINIEDIQSDENCLYRSLSRFL